jgi:plasmid stabilization system protein ParE
MTYTVIFSAPAEADLFAIYDYIAVRAGGAIALRFVETIEAYCLGFAHMPVTHDAVASIRQLQGHLEQ